MADAEPEQQPRRVGLALRLDRGEQIVHRLVLPPLAAEQVVAMMLQPEDVGRPLVQPAQFQKLGDALLAQPLDVERAAADEMPERSEEHTSELQSLMRISYAVFCLKKKK